MSTTEPKENLMNWLRDAHAMEQQAETMLNSQSSRLEHYPVLKDRIDQHIRETQGQQQRLETCIERLGGSPSAIKDMGGKVMAFAQGMSGMAIFIYNDRQRSIGSIKGLNEDFSNMPIHMSTTMDSYV